MFYKTLIGFDKPSIRINIYYFNCLPLRIAEAVRMNAPESILVLLLFFCVLVAYFEFGNISGLKSEVTNSTLVCYRQQCCALTADVQNRRFLNEEIIHRLLSIVYIT